MGKGLSKEFKLIQNFQIPLKKDTPKYLVQTEECYFDLGFMSAAKFVIQKTQTEVVVKKLNKSVENRQMFTFEVYVLSQLEHPSITTIIDYFQTKISYFIIYQYFNGIPIIDYLKQNPQQRNIAFVKAITEKLLQVVSYMHQKKFAHRGIDHSKIIFDGKQMILTGFTNAREFDTKQYKKNKCFKGVGTTLKVAYWPPEQYQYQSTEKIDIWCIGIFVYLMLTGFYPFESLGEDLQITVEKNQPNISRLRQQKIPKKIIKFIESCLHKDPQRRPPADLLLNYNWFNRGSKVDFNQLDSEDCKIDLYKVLREQPFLQYLKIIYVSKMMTIEQKQLYTRIFNQFDLNGNGQMNRSQFTKAVQFLDQNIQEITIEKLFKKIDINNNGTVDYEEFVASLIDNRIFKQVFSIEAIIDLIEQEHVEKIFRYEFENFFNKYGNPDEVSKMAQKIFNSQQVISSQKFQGTLVKCVSNMMIESLQTGNRRKSSIMQEFQSL